MNGRTKNLGLGYSGLAKAVYLACLGMAGQQAIAQEPVEEVTVTGSRLIQSGVNTPTPVTAVSAAELQTMAPTTLPASDTLTAGARRRKTAASPMQAAAQNTKIATSEGEKAPDIGRTGCRGGCAVRYLRRRSVT